jgi:hypothetical protein
MGLKFVLGLIVLVVLIEMILTVFNVPIFGQDYTPIKFAEKVEEEVTHITMDAGVGMSVIDPITEKIKNKIEEFGLNSEKVKNEEADIKPRCGTCPAGWMGPNSNCECWRYVENEYGQGVRSKQYGQRNYVSSIVYT